MPSSDGARENPYVLPVGLPVPVDDGSVKHLLHSKLPRLPLRATNGRAVDLASLSAPTVLFFYPRTGVPGKSPNRGFGGEDWNDIPGARGCTPQSCGFRDSYDAWIQLGVEVFGVSTQTTEFQSEFKARNHVPFEYLSDIDLALVRAMQLPTFEFPVESGGPKTLIKRMSWFVYQGRIEEVFYPVFPPDQNASRMLAWVQTVLPFFIGVKQDGVMYRRESELSADELSRVFADSGIGRPHADKERLGRMLRHANLVVTARKGGELLGIARCLTDTAWCCYVSDLAVIREAQHQGVGKQLLSVVRQIVGPECTVLLNAAPAAEGYYPRVGFEPVASAWKIQRER